MTKTTDNVIYLPGAEDIEIPDPQMLLKAAHDFGDLEDVVILGTRKDGAIYAASSLIDGADILWLLELLKMHILPKPIQGD